jgi:hypothetical protein
VPAGAEGVRLMHRPPRRLVVRVRDWPEGAEVRATLTVEGTSGPVEHDVYASDGVFRFDRLPSGAETTFICRLRDDRIAYRAGIPADEAEVVLSLVAGAGVSGRVILPVAEELPRIEASGRGWSRRGKVREDGRFEIRGLPAGPIRITAGGCVWIDGEHRHYGGEMETRTGEEVEFRAEVE